MISMRAPLNQGEAGARGERGETGRSGLIVVRDRLELFEEKPKATNSIATPSPSTETETGSRQKATSSDSASRSDALERLAFVEAEQMLVVRTSSGWRPIQLMRPLRDLRKVGVARNPKLNSATGGRPSRGRFSGGAAAAVDDNDDNDDDDRFAIDLNDIDEDDEDEDDDDGDGADADADEEDNADEEDDEGDEKDDANDWKDRDANDDLDEDVIGDGRNEATRQRKKHSRNELAPFLLQRSQRQQQRPSKVAAARTPAGKQLDPSSQLKVSGRSAVAPLDAMMPRSINAGETQMKQRGPEQEASASSASSLKVS